MIKLMKSRILSTILLLLLGATSATPLIAGRAVTQVTIKARFVEVSQDNLDELRMKWVVGIDRGATLSECLENRRVIIFHDEDADGKLDSGEFTIKKGRTNKKGRFVRKGKIWPPEGDTVSVRVKKTGECKKAIASTATPASP